MQQVVKQKLKSNEDLILSSYGKIEQFDEKFDKLLVDLEAAAPDLDQCELILLHSSVYDQLSERKAADIRKRVERLCQEEPSFCSRFKVELTWISSSLIPVIGFVTGQKTLAQLINFIGIGPMPIWWLAAPAGIGVGIFLYRRFSRR